MVHPVCDEITATFPEVARDFGRELAISELEEAINESDRHGIMTGDGTIVPILSISEFPVGVPVKGSRGRKPQWTDRRYAELVRDIENGTVGHWRLARNTVRQYANEAVRRGIAEPASAAGSWKRGIRPTRAGSSSATPSSLCRARRQGTTGQTPRPLPFASRAARASRCRA